MRHRKRELIIPRNASILVVCSQLGHFLVYVALASHAGFGQQTLIAGVDLGAPVLQANAGLPRYWRPGLPLTTSLPSSHAAAIARGIPWKGLEFTVYDAAANMTAYTEKSPGALNIYQALACKAPAVVIGHSNRSQSHLSASATSVYTDYDFIIDRLIKDSSASSLPSKPDIVVTRPGGSLTVNGDQVNFTYIGFPSLQAGSTYLIFLAYIPASTAYQAMDSYSTLAASGAGTWVIARQSVGTAGFTKGTFETSIGAWLTSCK